MGTRSVRDLVSLPITWSLVSVRARLLPTERWLATPRGTAAGGSLMVRGQVLRVVMAVACIAVEAADRIRARSTPTAADLADPS
jgi:hypothetical protein